MLQVTKTNKMREEHTNTDGGYAYVILVAYFLGHFLVYGISCTMGIFYNEFRDIFEDSNASISLISSLHTAMLFLIGKSSH